MIQINDFSFLTYMYTFTTSSIPYGSPLLFIFNNCRKYDLCTTTIDADMDGVKKYKWKEASIIIIHPTTSTIDHHGLDLITYKYAFRNRKLCFFCSKTGYNFQGEIRLHTVTRIHSMPFIWKGRLSRGNIFSFGYFHLDSFLRENNDR